MEKKLKKELTKVYILLGIGAILALYFIVNYDVTLSDWYGVVIFLLYPLGAVYGWRTMLRIFSGGMNGHKTGDPYYDDNIKLSVNYMSFQFAFSATAAIAVGWIVGLFVVVKKINYLKSQIN